MSNNPIIDDINLNFRNEIEKINVEIEHLIIEKQAFTEFADRIENISINNIRASNAPDFFTGNSGRSTITDRVKHIYSETIIDIPHYNDIYGEPIEENMIHELGYDLYLAVEKSTSLQPYLINSLIKAATDAAERRKNFKDVVEKEKRYIRNFENSAREIYEELTELNIDRPGRSDSAKNQEHDKILERLLSECEELAVKRQCKIQSRTKIAGELYTGDFEEYLYSELENTYPILNLLSQFMRVIKDGTNSWSSNKKSF
jgi:hypothetical protein